jgi:hypothetical protein
MKLLRFAGNARAEAPASGVLAAAEVDRDDALVHVAADVRRLSSEIGPGLSREIHLDLNRGSGVHDDPVAVC